MSFIDHVLHAFPVPARVGMPAVGLDISDRSIKFIELIPHGHSFAVGRFGTVEIPEGIVVGGLIQQKEQLVEVLQKLRDDYGLSYVRAALPEEPGYIFTTNVPKVSDDEVRSLLSFKLEEHVPLAPAEATIDFDEMKGCESEKITPPAGNKTVAVSVYPSKIATDYASLLHEAGLVPVSLEIEAQCVSRAIVPAQEKCGCMTVDVGSVRAGITVVGGGAVRFTTTADISGESLSDIIKQAFPKASHEEIVAIKNTEGLAHRSDETVRKAFQTFAEKLAQEIEKYYMYWQTRKDLKDRQLPEHQIKKIILSGGDANIAGLPEFIERTVRVPTRRANAWINVLDAQKNIPPISYEDSLGYASAIGLAMRRDI